MPQMEFSEKKPSFLEWLWDRYQTTPIIELDLFKKTAYRNARREYEKAMEWYRRRYRYEMEIRERLIAANPFKEQEENLNGNYEQS